MEVDLARDTCIMSDFWKEFILMPPEIAGIDLTAFKSVVEYRNKGLSATARNTLHRAYKKKYHSTIISWGERNKYLDDIHQINTSKPERQGRPMSLHYMNYPSKTTGNDACANHKTYFFTCFTHAGKLVAYISAHVCGELIAASQILGHADYLKDGIMIQLWEFMVRFALFYHLKVVVYSRWRDGTDGLRAWKHSVGMKPMELTELNQTT